MPTLFQTSLSTPFFFFLNHGEQFTLWRCTTSVLQFSFFMLFFRHAHAVLFVYFWLCWVSVAACGLSLVLESRGCSLVAACRLLTAVASLVAEHRLWGTQASVVSACRLRSCGLWTLEPRLGSCGTWAYLLQSIWDLLGPGIKPVSPALSGIFLSVVPPRKSPHHFSNNICSLCVSVLHFGYYCHISKPPLEKYYDSWRLSWWLALFSNKVFFN